MATSPSPPCFSEKWRPMFPWILNTDVDSSCLHSRPNGKPSFCLSVSEWLKEIWAIHTVEYCLVITKDRLLICATGWNNFQKKIILSERKSTLESYILCVSIYRSILETWRVKYCPTPCGQGRLLGIVSLQQVAWCPLPIPSLLTILWEQLGIPGQTAVSIRGFTLWGKLC